MEDARLRERRRRFKGIAMKQKTKIIIVASIPLLVMILAPAVGFLASRIFYWQGKQYFERVNRKPSVYTYTYINDRFFPAYYIEDTALYVAFEEYYDSVWTKARFRPINFPLKLMPFTKPAYIIGYERDSALVKVVTFKMCCMGYIEGYVMREALHNEPPSDSLIRVFKNSPIVDNTFVRSKSFEYGLFCYGIVCDE